MGIFDYIINNNPSSIEEAEENLNKVTKKVVEEQNKQKEKEVDDSVFGGKNGN